VKRTLVSRLVMLGVVAAGAAAAGWALGASAGVLAAMVAAAVWLQAAVWIYRAQQDAQTTVARANDFAQALIDAIPDPMYVKRRGGHYVMVNDAFARYHGLSRDEVLARGLHYDDAANHLLSLQEDERILAGGELRKEEHTVQRLTGAEVFRILSKRRSTFLDGDAVVVGIDHHITEWRQAERELRRLAQEDMLTGIANRRAFSTEAERALHAAERSGLPLTLLLLDLDHFKRINDTHGHNVGDEVLRELAQRMLQVLRKSDLAGRWGGEEFSALLQGEAEAARTVAERLREAVAGRPFDTGAGPLAVTLSGGCAAWRPGDTLAALVARADAALYAAKAQGRNQVQLAAALG
jgi:diguanylate cyclase (GGDEF)-like protein/PAS domain S-box-containing protein